MGDNNGLRNFLNYKGRTLTFKCYICGQMHEVPLDESGHYEGKTPCDPHTIHRVQVDPQTWRDAIEEAHDKIVH